MLDPLIKIISETIWFFLPAVVGNMAPVVAARYGWLAFLAHPLDGGCSWRGQRLLGDNKTYRGFVVGILAGGITGALQSLVVPSSPVSAFIIGAWIGFAALAGDAAKSFFKRQLNIPSGRPWRPWDQIDLVLGVVVLTAWFVPLTAAHIVTAFAVIGAGSYIVSAIAVRAGIKRAL